MRSAVATLLLIILLQAMMLIRQAVPPGLPPVPELPSPAEISASIQPDRLGSDLFMTTLRADTSGSDIDNLLLPDVVARPISTKIVFPELLLSSLPNPYLMWCSASDIPLVDTPGVSITQLDAIIPLPDISNAAEEQDPGLSLISMPTPGLLYPAGMALMSLVTAVVVLLHWIK